MEVSDGHVIMAVLPEKFDTVVPQVLTLAEENGLVCFDPQAGQVYLPPHLAAKQGGAAPSRAWTMQSGATRSDRETEWHPSAGEVVAVERNPGDFTPPDYLLVEITPDSRRAKLRPLHAGRVIPDVNVTECCDRLRSSHNPQSGDGTFC
jgi:hypothetical protein